MWTGRGGWLVLIHVADGREKALGLALEAWVSGCQQWQSPGHGGQGCSPLTSPPPQPPSPGIPEAQGINFL